MLTSAGDDSSSLRGLSPRPYVYGPHALPTELERLPACAQKEKHPPPSYLAPRAGALAIGTDTTTRAMMLLGQWLPLGRRHPRRPDKCQ